MNILVFMSAPPTEPARPTRLPAHAVWDTEHRLWRVGAIDDAGRWHGEQCTYRSNGTLQGEFTYVAGKPDGKFRRYHPDGTLSIEGEHRLGAPIGTHVTYRSSQANDEAVHTCCLPPNACKLLTHYPEDGRLLEDYFDADGRRLLRDGSPYPELPADVPATARFDVQRPAWIDGRYDRGKQHGCFSYWSAAGELQEVANFKHGQLDGLRERFRDEHCVERRMYKSGQPDGCAWEQVARDRFENSTIVAHEGFYERGKHCGKWRYLNAAGQIVTTVDLGHAVDEVSPEDAVFHTVTPQDTLTLDPAREHVRRVLYAAHNHDDATLRAEVDAIPQLLTKVSEKIATQLRNEKLEPSQYVAKLLHWMMRGLRAEHVFRSLSAMFLREPAVGLQLLTVASRLAPSEVETRAARVLFLTGLGRLSEAREKIAELAATHPAEASELSFNLRVTFPRFDYWPAQVTFPSEVSPELPTEAAPELTRLRVALSKAAARLGEVRQAILAQTRKPDNEFELPPDLSHWLITQPTALDGYTFETSDEQTSERDTVVVEERLVTTGFTLPELMLQARTEWTTLCWLRFAAGLPVSTGQLELPEELLPQPGFGQALTQAFQELYRVTDQLKTSGIRSRSQGMVDCTWEDTPISQLSRGLLVQAFAEMRERRAALYFAADDTCRSAWQDDLRAT